MTKPKTKQDLTAVSGGRLLTVRFVLALLLMAVGIAWVVYYYVVVRVDPTAAAGARSRADPPSWATSATGTT